MFFQRRKKESKNMIRKSFYFSVKQNLTKSQRSLCTQLVTLQLATVYGKKKERFKGLPKEKCFCYVIWIEDKVHFMFYLLII